MAAEGSAGHAPTAGEYIVHHLQHLQNKKQTGVVDFSVFNADSIFWAVLLGVLGCFLLWRAARSASPANGSRPSSPRPSSGWASCKPRAATATRC